MISNSFCFSRSICYKYINNVSKNHIFAEKKICVFKHFKFFLS